MNNTSFTSVNVARQLAMDRIEQAYRKADIHFGRWFVRPVVKFDLKGRTAGKAYLGRNLIQLNREMMMMNGQSFIDDTPGHEAAHLIVHQVYGLGTSRFTRVMPHGHEWKSVMRIIGQEPNRCHQFDVPVNPNRVTYKYLCNCQVHTVSRTIHNRVQNGVRTYSCRKCATRLVWEVQKTAVNIGTNNTVEANHNIRW
jgi:SprT protein